MIDLICLITHACSLSVCTLYIVLCISIAQQVIQHSGSVDLALHSYENMAVIPDPASQISVHCPILKESSLSSLALSATVLPTYLKALHCTGGSLSMDSGG